MRAFAVRVDPHTLRSTIHRADCSVVANKGPVQGVWQPMMAETPETVQAGWDEENDTAERNLPPTVICRCTR